MQRARVLGVLASTCRRGCRFQHTDAPKAVVEIKRRPLPTSTSIQYTIPTDPYLLAEKFRKLARSDKLDDAVALVMQSKAKHQSPVVWNLVIGEYARLGRLSRALRGYTEMRRRGFTPTQTTFTSLLKACAVSDSDKSVKMAEQIFESMDEFGMKPSIINVNALLGVYQRKHLLDPMLAWFNDLPANGPNAPSLATYSILLSTCRREILRQMDAMPNPRQPRHDTDGKSSDGKPSDRQPSDRKPSDRNPSGRMLSRDEVGQLTLAKENIRSAFTAMLQIWETFAEDAARRAQQVLRDTEPLTLDTHIIKTMLKTCHALYGESRPLGRKGINILEQVYGFDKSFDARPASEPPKTPLAAVIRSSLTGDDAKVPVVDNDVVRLALELCTRDRQSTKAIRFWRSLETNFALDIEPFKSQHASELAKLRSSAKLPRPDSSD
ncbi:hypothetical protein GGF46_004344 [Coemansia sp. RSA 552]|nr:hypothetical protein GGF46_004344 [Coemansia sp. RSA 552]